MKQKTPLKIVPAPPMTAILIPFADRVTRFVKAWCADPLPEVYLNQQIDKLDLHLIFKYNYINQVDFDNDTKHFKNFLLFIKALDIEPRTSRKTKTFVDELLRSFETQQALDKIKNRKTKKKVGKAKPRLIPVAGNKAAFKYMNDELNRETELKDTDSVRIMEGRMFEDKKIKWLEPNGEKSLVQFLILLYNTKDPHYIEKVPNKHKDFIYSYIRENFYIVANPNPTTQQFSDAARKTNQKLKSFLTRVNNIIRAMNSK